MPEGATKAPPGSSDVASGPPGAPGEIRALVLMATFDGGAFLERQLDTLAAQTVPRIDVLASDDGSRDATPAILARRAALWSKGSFTIRSGPASGFAENFRSLIAAAGDDATHVFFCDQDDEWDADKMAVAIRGLDAAGDRPALYFGRTRSIDEAGAPLGASPLFRRPPSFRNAVVQSIGGGNTIALNADGFALLRESARRTGFVSHDWWSYMIVTGAGGKVIYDPVPRMGYRQHGANVVGSNRGARAGFTRLRRLFEGRFAGWTDRNLDGLTACRDLLSPEAAALVDELALARRAGPVRCALALGRLGIHRQTALSSIALYSAALLSRV